MKKTVFLSAFAFVTGLAVAGALSYAHFSDEARAREAALAFEIERAGSVETGFYTRLPIYDDFRTAAREAELRKHLLGDHLQIAQATGVEPPASDARIEELEASGELVNIDGPEDLYYFYNVPTRYRYLTPGAARGLNRLTEKLQQVLNRYGDYPPIKIALSSVIRPAAYQENLRRSNANASLVSSHSYGVSFDIFYDDFFVDLPGEDPALEPLRLRLGFLLGRSLRRQFHAVLAETLLELQSEGAVYVIWERNQRCYHVTVRSEN
ncbi:MAG: hypothetical protein H7A21_18885 [Spirochaetales bacterium]|nr:hypothetical protein [Leptospiraceae bacterium]MCP5483510.1 hypothetical protein [Spirochaetales bacterium]MCP5486738.1 hypothetical protein [Spirochaetales bacterium]